MQHMIRFRPAIQIHSKQRALGQIEWLMSLFEQNFFKL